ncbi:MAG TPA: hypothetical protein VG123_04250 [Streptosporangiaceae bacterium]|nr:hypothetical protein [Streptosporangiaceae bacterium]
MADTENMNRERAEAHLRLLAEEELRRAAILVPDGAAGRPPGEAMRRASVTGTLAGSGALPDAVMASDGARGAGRGGTGLYPVHYRALVRLAVFLVRDTRAAEQVVQDAFAALRDGGPQPQDTDAALAYLRQAVVNRSRLVLRDRSVPGLRRHLVARVARVLAAVGALDDEVADQILEDFELALAARRAPAPGQAGPASWTQSPPVRPRPARPGARSGRVARLGQVIPVRGADMAGEVCLLSYARTASGPQFSLLARTSRVPGPAPAHPWPEIPLLEQFTATDDRGTRYRMRVRDLGGGANGWTLMLDPDPPHEPRWLDLTTIPGEPAVRIDLTPPPDTATVTAGAATASPGEHLLHAVAARLLAAGPIPAGTGPGPAAPEPGPLSAAADELGDVIAALQTAGALSRLSPVPGQLAALCARLNAGSHGITESPAADLPEPWLSMLAHYQRSKTRAAPAGDGCAAAAAVLADLDGITLAILGLHNCQGRTVMHMHASGPMCQLSGHPDDPWSDHPDEHYRWPVTWIRDSGGRWHTTRIRGRSEMNDQVGLRLEVIPPLSRATAWIEVLAAGHSAQARATLPLRWQ